MQEQMRHIPPFGLRMPTPMREFVREQARKNGSSQNSEILRAIRERMERMQTEGRA